jgi:ribosome-associated translation inhibitor RaiA
MAAVDLALGKAEAQLRRYKEKIQDRRRRPSAGEVPEAPEGESVE